MNTLEHKQALRQFHALCRQLGMSADDKHALVGVEGADSSADLPTARLLAICENLRRQADPRLGQRDALRKRVMGAIGAWLRSAGYADNAAMIKAVACRAAGYGSFNDIPAGRLNNLWHNFNNKKIDRIAAERLMSDLVGHTTDYSALSSGANMPS